MPLQHDINGGTVAQLPTLPAYLYPRDHSLARRRLAIATITTQAYNHCSLNHSSTPSVPIMKLSSVSALAALLGAGLVYAAPTAEAESVSPPH